MLPLKQRREEGKIVFLRYTELLIKDRTTLSWTDADDGSARRDITSGVARICSSSSACYLGAESSPGDSGKEAVFLPATSSRGASPILAKGGPTSSGGDERAGATGAADRTRVLNTGSSARPRQQKKHLRCSHK